MSFHSFPSSNFLILNNNILLKSIIHILRNGLSRSTWISDKNGQKFEVNIDDFKIIRTLGKGTFGEVFEMIHQPTQFICAIKVNKIN